MPLPLALFGLSGFAGLVYETVWTRWLVLIFGATVPSASTIFAGFMGGMALGAALGARWAKTAKAPLRLYGWLELGIGATAALFPLALKLMTHFVETTSIPIAPLRVVLCWAAILPAAILMGATFPVIVAHRGGEEGRETGNLYAANLGGACLGVLLTAFVFLAFIGLQSTHWLAVFINLLVGAVALRASSSISRPAASVPAGRLPLWPAAAVMLSGFCGMAFEVLWIRMLVPSFNNSAYGFASVLVVFLGGLGAGSWIAARVKAVRVEHLGALLGVSAVLGFVAYDAFGLTQLLQVRFADMTDSGFKPMILVPLAEAVVVLGPLAVAQGLFLPLAVRLSGGSAAGRLYAWNTFGAILGSLCVGFWWIPVYKVQVTFIAILAVAALGGAAVWAAGVREARARWGFAAAAVFGLALAWSRLEGHYLPAEAMKEWMTRFRHLDPELLAYAEDREGSVAVQRRGGGRFLVINGVGVTGYNNATKMLAHVPLALHPKPERALMICFGMGTTFRSTLRHPVTLDSVEIAGSVYGMFPLFFPDAARWASDPRARLIVNDGRNHLLRAREGYDVIMVDPSPPLYAAGTVNLYSRDFYALALSRLRPGGLLAVWLPECPEPEFKMILKSFKRAAPYSEVWLGSHTGGGLIMLGSASPIPIDRERVRRRLADAGVRRDMAELNGELAGEASFWRLRLDSGARFEDYVADAPEVTDDFPRIEYPYFRAQRADFARRPPLLAWPQAL